MVCSACVNRIERAPAHLSRSGRMEVRWRLGSPRGSSLVPKIELHSFSSMHAWASAVVVKESGILIDA